MADMGGRLDSARQGLPDAVWERPGMPFGEWLEHEAAAIRVKAKRAGTIARPQSM